MIVMDQQNDHNNKEKTVLYESSTILQKLCPFLYPLQCKDDVIELEEYFDKHLGPAIRCIIYYESGTPRYHPTLSDILCKHTSYIESYLFRRATPKFVKLILKYNQVNDETAEKSLDEIRVIFDKVSDRLSDGRDYLFEEPQKESDSNKMESKSPPSRNGFTSADLTFAALASLLLFPKELMPMQMQNKIDPNKQTPLSYSDNSVPSIPNKLLSLRDELRETLAGKHALKMYHKHRLATTLPSSGVIHGESGSKSQCIRGKALGLNFVVPKSIGRNQVSWVGLGTTMFIVGTGLCVGAASFYQLSSFRNLPKQSR